MSRKPKEFQCVCRACQQYFTHSNITIYCPGCENVINYMDICLEDNNFKDTVITSLVKGFIDRYGLDEIFYDFIQKRIKDAIKDETDKYESDYE